MHLIIFIVFGLAIAIFDELDNEMFAGLLWGFLILGTFGAFIQSFAYRTISRSFNIHRWSGFLFIFLVELILINLAYIAQGSKPMTWLLITNNLSNSSTFIYKGAVSMHIGILISSLVATFMIPINHHIEEEKERLPIT
ncbi:hypothetical protein [Pontibacter populi]|uniref:Uncharacterized protein n=1 Tax=Pontibacter populi TaxID=890055 RepID=A0ABV1RZY4_9BACT